MFFVIFLQDKQFKIAIELWAAESVAGIEVIILTERGEYFY